MSKSTLLLALAVLLAVPGGCGRPQRVTKHAISGTVTHGGETVPRGSLRLTPDFDKGNRGPATTIMFENGKYQSLEGYGVVGGAYTVVIEGTEALTPDMIAAQIEPKPLFKPYTVAVDFPPGESVKDFDVPKEK